MSYDDTVDGEVKPPKQTDVLIDIADDAVLFHAPNGIAFADIEVNGHRETWPVRMKGFRRWLIRRFFIATNKAPGSEALQSALNLIEAKAHFDGPEHAVGVRVAGLAEKIYLDLADEHWRAIEIDANGWQIIDRPEVHFRRAAGMLPLPIPERGGSIEALRPFLNVQTKEQFVLAVAWVLAALRDRGPYPVLALAGEQGSAKSTASKLLRELVDPNAAPLRALPREDRDLFIAANNAHVLVFDNVSGLHPWISDTICRLATGGGFAVRQLYTDQDEVLFDAQRPVILNGIEDIVERPDLADRSLFLTLEPIPKGKRRAEREIMAKFYAARPKIMGALLDVVVHGLKHLPRTELGELPRMADFALWVTACEQAMWKKGTFISAYTGNIDEATQTLIEGDIVGAAIIKFMGEKTRWTGAAHDLLEALNLQVGEAATKRRDWPKSPRAMGGQLRKLAPSFRRIGLEVKFLPRASYGRPVHLEWIGKRPSQPSQPSLNRSFQPFPHDGGDGVYDGRHDQGDGRSGQPSLKKPLKSNGNDGHDGHDGQNPLYSSSPSGEDDRRARCAQCGEPGSKLVEASDGTHTARLHRECLDAWAANGLARLACLPGPASQCGPLGC